MKNVLTFACGRAVVLITRILACTLSLTLLIGSASAAELVTDGSTPLGLTPGSPAGSYALGDFETVNLYNGSLNFQLPLLKLGGRGGTSSAIMFYLNQKWLVEKEIDQPNRYYPRGNWWSDDTGYVSPFSIGKLDARQGGSRDFVILAACGYVRRQTLTRLTFTAPDGTEYELRDALTNGQPHTTTPATCTPWENFFNRGRVFVTADGSSATFISDADVKDYPYDNPANVAPTGYMLLRDGTRYRVRAGGVVEWMRDRNGNRISFSYNLLQQRLTGVTDSLNRQVTIDYATGEIRYKGFGGAARTIRFTYSTLQNALRADYTLQTYQQLFPELNDASPSPANPDVISSVTLPDGRQYQLRYNSYAELARVVLPTGGAIEYDYAAGTTDGPPSGVITIFPDKHIYRRVVERRVYPDGGTGATYAIRMTYSRPESSTFNAGYVITEQFNNGGTLLGHQRHYFYGSPRASFGQQPTQYPAYKDGREYRTDVYDANGTTLLRQVEHTFVQRAPVSWWTGDPELAPPNDPRLIETKTTLVDSNQVAKQTFDYDQYNNQIDVYEYDYGSGAPPTRPTRHTHTDYLTVNPANGIDYRTTGVHIRNLPRAQQTYAVNQTTGAETLVAQSEMHYDEYVSYPLITYATVTGWSDPGTTARGNMTRERHWLDTAGDYLTTHRQYDQCGNVRNTEDPRGKTYSVVYADSFSDSISRNTYAYPTQTISPVPDTSGTHGSTTALVTSSVYDFSTGLVTSTTDANNQTTSFQYNDPLNRLTRVLRPAGGGETLYIYDIYQGSHYVRTRTAQSVSQMVDAYQFFDGLGRPNRTFTAWDGSQWVTTDTQYDALGRAWRVSNPYRSSGAASDVNPSGRWTTTGYDALGRVRTVTTPDNAVVTTSYMGNQVTVTDQTNKSRRSVTDALGRLTQVVEDPSGVAYQTDYTYDVLNNLRKVVQATAQVTQQRFFMYDSLSRLIRAKNPEQAANGSLALTDPVTDNSQWSMAYAYDPNGNLVTRTDARGVTTTYAYDALNRNTTVDYSDTTTINPDIYRHYDGAINGRGRFWQAYAGGNFSVGSTVEHTYIGSYDAMGRPLSGQQTFKTGGVWSAPYTMRRTYDLAGHALSQTYPSGRTVNYTYDGAGRTNDFRGNLGDGIGRIYATGISYDLFGGLKQEQL